jgi:glycosyltransferase involved in cell wall biosynthesis
MRILHVTESMGAGVATAIGQYVRSAGPGASHSVLARVRSDSFAQEPWLEAIPHVLVGSVPALVAKWIRARDQHIDVVHAHSTIAGQLTRALPHPRARVVYSPHGLAAVHHRRQVVRSVLGVTERLLESRTGALAAVSASEEADLSTLGLRLPISRLPHAQPMSPDVAPRESRTGNVVSVGRLTYQKAPDTVLDLPQRLQQYGVGGSCVWVGDGNAEVRSRLRANGWTVTGWVDSAEVRRLLTEASVMLHPARYEGFSIAIVEALSLGTPVVARRIPSNEEFRGVRTFVGIDEAVELLGDLLTRDDSWDQISKEARDYVASAHSEHSQRQALRGLYSSVVLS